MKTYDITRRNCSLSLMIDHRLQEAVRLLEEPAALVCSKARRFAVLAAKPRINGLTL
jgi:hypothetical protein